jgi:hypothetical protein
MFGNIPALTLRRGHEVQEAGLVLVVAKAAEVLDTGFSELHKLKDSELPS